MKKALRSPLLLLTLLTFLSPCSLLSQIRLTEVAPTNNGQITDEDNERPDWIEILNGSTQVANLYGWGLSDGSQSSRWLLPETNLEPGERMLVFASGKNRGGNSAPNSVIDHWETALYDADEWQYILGTNPPPSDWNSITFDASTWSTGAGGFGYGDNDDATVVPNGTISVYYRQRFSVADPAELKEAVLSMDYDDGFVAYLNGQEIARSSNMSGAPNNNTLAVPDREATGLPPEDYRIDALTLINLLVPGDNVLAVEIHNTAVSSSDMTGRTWLHFGVASSGQIYDAIPTWFNPGSFSGSVLHTDFKLNFEDKLTLSNLAGNVVDSLIVGQLQPGHSHMRLNDDGAWCTTATPTPGAINGWDCLDGYAEVPGYVLSAGFYSGTQSVALTGSGEIRYTLDGSVPTASATLYTNPISVAATTVLRARGFDATKWPSAVATSTYFINEPTTLTAVSVSLPPDDFSDVYDNYSRKGTVAVEYFDQQQQRQFVGDFAGYVVGNWSVAFAQKSLQFDVDEDYGSTREIGYPIFAPDKPIPSLRAFRIRNEDDDYMLARMRDRIVNELAAETYSARAAYRNVAAFINGEYWGHYVAREHLDNFFVRDNYGADPDSVNIVKTYYNLVSGTTLDEAETGSLDDFHAMSDYISNNDMGNAANFQRAAQLLDLDNFTDYMETEIFVASTDWLQDYYNNIRLFKTRKNAPWKFLLWDVSYSSGNGSGCSSCDVLGTTLGNTSRYGQLLNSLLDNPEYRRYFINRFADLMNTSFLASRAHTLINTNATELGPEIDRHNERWGTGNFSAWSQAVQELRNFYTQRPGNQREHIIDNFQLDQEVSITLNANPPGAGTVKISTVVPETLPWTGIYFHGNPVTVTAIPNPGFTFNNWTANANISNVTSSTFTADVAGNTTFTANFLGSTGSTALKITEINYHSDPTRDGGDWFELRNEGAIPLDVSDFSVQDKDWFHRFLVPTGTVIQPEDNLVFAENLSKFSAEYPNVTNVVSMPLSFELSDKNDEIHVYDRLGAMAAWALYRDESPWPDLADGYGLTLERYVSGVDPAEPGNWFLGCVGGSPGAIHSFCPESSLLTEINYNSATNADAGDWFELYNGTSSPIDLSGWQLRDGSDDQVFTFPAQTIITPAEGYRVFYQDDTKFLAQFPAVTNKTGPFGFGFSGSSDLLRLYDAGGRLYLSMRYRDSAPWPIEPDGGGYTLEKSDFSTLLNDPFAWVAGCIGGSPGAAYDPNCGSVGTNTLLDTAHEMMVWPNPAQELFMIKIAGGMNADVQLIDIFGKTVTQYATINGETRIQTTNLPRGMYFVVAVSTGKKLVKKVILE